jgi:hypothetical protein
LFAKNQFSKIQCFLSWRLLSQANAQNKLSDYADEKAKKITPPRCPSQNSRKSAFYQVTEGADDNRDSILSFINTTEKENNFCENLYEPTPEKLFSPTFRQSYNAAHSDYHDA